MMIAVTYHRDGAVRTRSTKLPAGRCTGAATKTDTVCSVTATNRATAITKSRILQNVVTEIISNMSMASLHALGVGDETPGRAQLSPGRAQLSNELGEMTITKHSRPAVISTYRIAASR